MILTVTETGPDHPIYKQKAVGFTIRNEPMRAIETYQKDNKVQSEKLGKYTHNKIVNDEIIDYHQHGEINLTTKEVTYYER